MESFLRRSGTFIHICFKISSIQNKLSVSSAKDIVEAMEDQHHVTVEENQIQMGDITRAGDHNITILTGINDGSVLISAQVVPE